MTWKDTIHIGKVILSTLSLPLLAIQVGQHGAYGRPGEWHLWCESLGIQMRRLQSESLADARKEAVELCKAICGQYLESLREAAK